MTALADQSDQSVAVEEIIEGVEVVGDCSDKVQVLHQGLVHITKLSGPW